LIGWGLRRYGNVNAGFRPRAGARRLDIVEMAPIDSKRRLVLVRRDETEHLLLLTASGDIVVETGIETPVTGAGTVVEQEPAA
jgi:flagellar protein FliO/FliZ